ncbi:MAG TPA: cache domain-containing protein, partial [Bryobacteraceae bacterium]|nr:cache domain-containing protein [Bryobacteraceae bacterium]
MRVDLLFPRLSLKARLISNYLVVLGIGGLVTSLVGSWIVSSTIMMQARRSADLDLAVALTLYDNHLNGLKQAVGLVSTGATIQQHLRSRDRTVLFQYLETVYKTAGFDFLTLADPRGEVLLRVSNRERSGDSVPPLEVVRTALSGSTAAGTEILSPEVLGAENPALPARAHLRLVPTPRTSPSNKTEETSGLVQLVAAPVRGPAGDILGVLYGGVLLNRNFDLVDRAWDLLFQGDRFDGQDVGTVTIFQRDVRVATNVRTDRGERALGTLVSDEVREAVLGRGERWRDRAFVVNDWYISAYEPIRNPRGEIVGIFYVGLLEKAFTSIRNRVILSFFGLASAGFVLIIAITYYEILKITRPIGEMVASTRNIAAGRFDQEVRTDSVGEVKLLAASFNTMLESLRQMRNDLEEWGRTLEEKVNKRTEELVAMRARVEQAERLASLGKLAAGVAHEINNPLGGIMALTALSLEDMKPDDPNRENFEEVLRQSERCRDIVRGLLEFSRQSEAHMELVDLNKVLQDTLSLLERQALFLNINVVRNLDASLPPVMADRSQLQQLFMNILMNAVQAMNEKGTVTLSTCRNGSGQAEVAVSDTGSGIPADKIDRIFDPFYTTKPADQGTGLGLSIAYGIVTRHGGTISVES